MKCRHIHDSGKQCGALEQFVDEETGFCHAHGPGGAEHMRKIGTKGGTTTGRRKNGGLTDADLPPLTTPKDAQTWLEAIGRAVATNALGHQEATAAARTVREWLAAWERGSMAERLDELQTRLAEVTGADLRQVK